MRDFDQTMQTLKIVGWLCAVCLLLIGLLYEHPVTHAGTWSETPREHMILAGLGLMVVLIFLNRLLD